MSEPLILIRRNQVIEHEERLTWRDLAILNVSQSDACKYWYGHIEDPALVKANKKHANVYLGVQRVKLKKAGWIFNLDRTGKKIVRVIPPEESLPEYDHAYELACRQLGSNFAQRLRPRG